MFVCAKTHTFFLSKRAALACGSHSGVFGGHFLKMRVSQDYYINAGYRRFDIVPTARQKALINLQA